MAKKLRQQYFLKIAVSTIGVLFTVNLLYYAVLLDISVLKTKNPTSTAFIKYRQKQWARGGKKVVLHQKWVSLKKISPYVLKAAITSEDAKFWTHDGFDYDAIENAIEKNFESKSFKLGASTITQQLAKNLFLSPSKSPLRKLNEAILTHRIEKTLSKRRIIELYLNVAEWGDGIFGIQAASRFYFNTTASAVTPYQAALLAAVLPNPRRFNAAHPSRYIRKKATRIYRNITL